MKMQFSIEVPEWVYAEQIHHAVLDAVVEIVELKGYQGASWEACDQFVELYDEDGDLLLSSIPGSAITGGFDAVFDLLDKAIMLAPMGESHDRS